MRGMEGKIPSWGFRNFKSLPVEPLREVHAVCVSWKQINEILGSSIRDSLMVQVAADGFLSMIRTGCHDSRRLLALIYSVIGCDLPCAHVLRFNNEAARQIICNMAMLLQGVPIG